MNQIPTWFSLENYNKDLSLEDWAYEIWVRAHYYRHASFFNKSEFVIRSGIGPIDRMLIWLGNGLPASTENYEKFLSNRAHFSEYFSKQQEAWKAEKESPAIELYGIEDVLPPELFNELPALVDKSDIEAHLYSWCERALPIGVNLEKTDEELLIAFKRYLKESRKEQKEFFSLGKNIAGQTQEWKNFRLLALFDLLYWKEAFCESLTQVRIGDAIWPDDRVDDIGQKVRKAGVTLIEKVFSEKTAKAIYLEHLRTV